MLGIHFQIMVQDALHCNGVRKYIPEGDSLSEVEACCGGEGGGLLHRRQVPSARQLRNGGRPEHTARLL